jgi:hypothetical protein
MDDKFTQPAQQPQRIAARTLAILILVLLVSAIGAVFIFYPVGAISAAPEQPIAFSHRVHVTDKKLSCIFCHSGVVNADHAEIPPLETCMLCHQKVIIHYPMIVKLRKHYDERVPVEWNRIFYLPDFVFFSHQAHIQAGFDCGKCHGDIAHMDRVMLRGGDLKMGFCVQCHRDENFSHDCFICHR